MSKSESTKRAKEEFDRFQSAILDAHINITTFHQQDEISPDSCFPNNWISTHKNEDIPDGALILYPMLVPSREAEKNSTIVDTLKPQYKHFINF